MARNKLTTKVATEKQSFGATSYKQALFLNSESFFTIYGGAAMCLDATAEFLTEHGWKSISVYNGETDKVAQVDPVTSNLTFVKPLDYIKQKNETFSRMRARGLDLIHTDNHKVLYYSDKTGDNPKYIPFSEVKERHVKSKTKGWTGNIKTTFNPTFDGVDLTDDEIRLQVAIQADGSIKNQNIDGTKSVLIRVSKKRKAERLITLLNSVGVEYSYKEKYDTKYTNDTEHQFYFRDKLATKEFDSFWYKLSQKQLLVVVEEVGHWDGSIVESVNTIRYYSANKKNADFIQYAFHACGRNTNIHIESHPENPNWKDCYTVNGSLSGKGFRCFANKDGKIPIEDFKSTDGYCYCFTVPTGFFLVRQNNKVFITGNSGKSYMGLMKFLKWCDDPNFVGYVFRLHATDLKKEGGAFWEAVKMFQSFRKGTTYTQQPMVIRFPSGASVSFLGMDDKAGRDAIQGISISAAMCDEATHFQEEDIWWIVSRLRTEAKMSPCIWLTCNPDPNSYILPMIKDYYLHEEGDRVGNEDVGGRPREDRNGKQRYYLRVGNDLKWANTYEELYNSYHHKFGVNPLTGENLCKPRTFMFIGATCFDNPEAMRKNPDYVSSLASQSRVNTERLLKGNWFASEQESGYFKKEWIKQAGGLLDQRNPQDMSYLSKVTKRCRAWDMAGTVASEANPDPDWTVGVLIARTRDGMFIVEDVQRVRKRSGENTDFIIKIAKEDRKRFGNQVVTILPQDPAEAGKAIKIVRAKEFALNGIPVKFEKVGTRKSKLDKFTPFSASALNGIVCVLVNNEWCDEYFKELERFDGISRRYHDDQVDGTSTAYNYLATTKEYVKLNPSLIG